MYLYKILIVFRCFDHLRYWGKMYFRETPDWILCSPSSQCYSLIYLGNKKLAAFVKMRTAAVLVRRLTPIHKSRVHGCPPTNISAALESHPEAAYVNLAETSLFSSSSPLAIFLWCKTVSVCSLEEHQQGKLLYQVCEASQASSLQFVLTWKLAKGSRHMYCLQLLRHWQRFAAWHLCP